LKLKPPREETAVSGPTKYDKAENSYAWDMVAFHNVIARMQREIFDAMAQKGFHDGEFNFGESIALIHSELSEALEAHRKGVEVSEHCLELSGVEEELADTFIRLLHLAERVGCDLAQAVQVKQRFNMNRPHKHGKKY
jgi:NTP pyrophosphatase (non-canonical NTP hydrolase)